MSVLPNEASIRVVHTGWLPSSPPFTVPPSLPTTNTIPLKSLLSRLFVTSLLSYSTWAVQASFCMTSQLHFILLMFCLSWPPQHLILAPICLSLANLADLSVPSLVICLPSPLHSHRVHHFRYQPSMANSPFLLFPRCRPFFQ